MIWSVKNVTVILVCIVVTAWFFRYQYVTKTLNSVACVVRINRFTRKRCLLPTNNLVCPKIVASPPCSK